MENSFDFLSSMLDEVALEGLDGTTLPMFWKRLEDRPNFPISIDEDSKVFLWECIAMHKDIEFYELPEQREFVSPYNRYSSIDGELGIVIEPIEKIKDPYYPVVCVKDGHVRGSCSTYNTRKNITSNIRTDDMLLVSLSQAVDRWADALVLVASPRTRLLALIGTETNPLIEFTNEAYCLLERIGRSRYIGEVTQGDDGILSLNAPFCKQLHYYRKKLSLKGLITKQTHYLKNKRGTTTNGCLLHLTRFYVERKTKMELLLKALCDLLKDKPEQRETCAKARLELGIKESTFKKLFYRPFQKWILVSNIPYQEMYPNAPRKESHTHAGAEKTIKVVKLLKHYEEDDDKEDDNDEHDNVKASALPLNVHFDYTKIYHGYPFQKQIFDLIKEAGPEGISAADLGRATTLPRLDVRNSLRTLLKRKNVISLLVDRGRQKVTKYIAKIYESENEAYSVVKEHELSSAEKLIVSAKRKASSKNVHNSLPPKKKVRFEDEIQTESKENHVDVTVSDFQNIVSQVKELQSSEEFSGRSPKVLSVLEKPPTACVNALVSPQITYRKLKRSEMIINFLKEVKFSTICDLQKLIRELEKDEKHLLDKRSTARLVHSLANIKKIKIFKVVLKLEDKVTSLEYICDNSIEPTDPCIKAAIEQAKFKYFCVNKEKEKVSNVAGVKENIPIKVETNSESSKDTPKSNESFCITIYPKFIRARTLHKFLFYLVFQHEGKVIKLDQKSIYHDQMSWKRFVPPLPEYPENVKKGWCFLADIYSRIPLSIFVKIVAIRQSIPNLQEYLGDEEKQHYLIKFLPQDIRNALLDDRKYLFSTCEVIKNLCYMGLVTLGPQILKQKDQVYLYVHTNASLKDTTISCPGYIHVEPNLKYEIKPYAFKSLTDVDNFWFELENICFHTPLGKYNSVIGKTFAITEAAFKPELIKCVENVAFDKVTDSGSIPGDGLGAAGFDSSLFMHIKRNWQSSTMKPTAAAIKNDSKVATAKFSIQHLLKDESVLKPENRSRLQRLTKHSLSMKNKYQQNDIPPVLNTTPINLKGTVKPRRRPKTRFRTVKSRINKKRVPYYDERDKMALKKMKKCRCEWFPQEDTFLLLCRVASLFLDPLHNKNLVVPFTVVRDLLHMHLPEISDNKSSRACQRRIRYMMLNPITISNVAVFLGEAKQDEALVQEFNKEKPPKIQYVEWTNLFTSLLEKLLKKFSLSAADRCKNVIIPNSLVELHKNFEITYSRDILKSEEIHKGPKNISDVKFFVLCSLILSVMALNDNDVRWKYMLLQLYKKYPQNFLQSVIAHLRRKRLIAVKKSIFKSDVKRANSHSPYKFSIIYENALATKFPIKMFQEALNLHKSFSSINPETGVELKGDVPSGYAAYVLSLAAIGNLFIHTEIPEHIILFDASASLESIEQIFQTLDKKESNELSKILNNEASSFVIDKNIATKINRTSLSLTEDQASDDESSNMDCSTMRTTNASRYALYLLRQEKTQTPVERTQHSQDYIVLNSCRLFCRLKENPDIILPINPPEIIEEIPSLDKTVSSDVITNDKLQLDDNDITNVVKSLTFYVPPDALKRDNYSDFLETLYENYSPQTLLEGKYIFSYIYQAETIGVSEKTLWENFFQLLGELTWFEHLKILCESFLILRVGILSFSYVCIQYAKVWLLESCLWSDQFTGIRCDICASDKSRKEDQQCNHELSATYFDSCEKVYFIPRTWRNPDGTLNKSYFFELLNTVLSHIISSPSTSVSDVCEKFALVMQPVQTLELMEVLEKMKCIYKYYCKPVKKSTLFSKPATVYVTEKPTPDCIAHVENYPNAICKIAKFQNCLM